MKWDSQSRGNRVLPRRPTQGGFTLIELLAVVIVIGILAGLVLGISGYAAKKADISKATSELQKIKNTLEGYHMDFGHYPLESGFLSLNRDPRVSKHLYGYIVSNAYDFVITQEASSITNRLDDPWGTPYFYTNVSAQSYRLWSYGPDRLSNNATNRIDDVHSL